MPVAGLSSPSSVDPRLEASSKRDPQGEWPHFQGAQSGNRHDCQPNAKPLHRGHESLELKWNVNAFAMYGNDPSVDGGGHRVTHERGADGSMNDGVMRPVRIFLAQTRLVEPGINYEEPALSLFFPH